MRRRWIFLGLVILLGVLPMVFITYLPNTFLHAPEPRADGPQPVKHNLPAYPVPAAGRSALPDLEYLTYTERLLLMIDPLWFENYQGSYSWEELQSSDGSFAFSINSSWLLQHPSYPQVGLLIRQDAAKDIFEVSGGEVYLPKTGVGVSYEKLEKNDETRAFLRFKREF